MRRVLVKRLKETKVGDSTMQIGLTVVFGKNEEEWKGRITDIWTLRNGKIFYEIENVVSNSGKVQSFTIRDKDISEIVIE